MSVAEKSWRDEYPDVPDHVLDVVDHALRGYTMPFETLMRTPELERQARDIYETVARAGGEPVNVSSTHSPRPAQ